VKDAVVMAAGEGVRLRPLTERYAKPVLPIGGRPVIATLLRELRAAGVERAWVVVHYRGQQIRTLLGDGSGFGLELRYAEQPELDGSAGAVRAAVAAGARPPFLIAGADTLFAPADVRRFAEESRGTAGAIAVRQDPPPEPQHRWATRVEEGRVTRVLDDDPANPLSGAPLWLLTAATAPYLDGLGGPPYELAELFQRAVDDGLEIAGVEIGQTRDLTYPLDLMHENFTYLGSI
jgi:UDP-N-acetylglucosamine diphosphorylase / glucose-1-phosphate thymidylyltransferase / UDP-N-acetylgalactosamine diphosphorylase / glucosamine-1-phosphate N-acetyltransferase / galactosamine-1-phosphate N-acetyltransferase